MARVTLRYWAAAKAAAGVPEEQVEAATLADALAGVTARAGGRPELAKVLDRCAYVIDEEPVGTRPHEFVVLAEGAVVEVLPPFAGG
jgi:sulfur-carrier protein